MMNEVRNYQEFFTSEEQERTHCFKTEQDIGHTETAIHIEIPIFYYKMIPNTKFLVSEDKSSN